jgi:hypothetical protein
VATVRRIVGKLDPAEKERLPGTRNVNNLTIGALDPLAKIPEYKICTVVLEAVTTQFLC